MWRNIQTVCLDYRHAGRCPLLMQFLFHIWRKTESDVTTSDFMRFFHTNSPSCYRSDLCLLIRKKIWTGSLESCPVNPSVDIFGPKNRDLFFPPLFSLPLALAHLQRNLLCAAGLDTHTSGRWQKSIYAFATCQSRGKENMPLKAASKTRGRREVIYHVCFVRSGTSCRAL